MSRWIVALTFLVLVSKAVAGNYFVGNELHAFCQSDNLARQHACIGYITGIADVLAEGDTVDGWRACISLGVTNSRLTSVVKSWLEQHVENRHRSAPRLVAEALAETYPCE